MDIEAPCSDNVETVMKPKHCMLEKRKEYSLITLLGYSWVDDEVGSFYSRNSDKVSILYFINYVNVCAFMDDEFSPTPLHCCQNDAYEKSN